MNNIELFRKFGVTVINNMTNTWFKLINPKESKPKDLVEFDYRGLKCSLMFREMDSLQLMTLNVQEYPVAIFRRHTKRHIEELQYTNLHFYTPEMLLEIITAFKPPFEIPNHGYKYEPLTTPDTLVEGMEFKWEYVADNYISYTWLENNVVIGHCHILSNKDSGIEVEMTNFEMEYETVKEFSKGDLDIVIKKEGYLEDYEMPYGRNDRELKPRKIAPHSITTKIYDRVLRILIIEFEDGDGKSKKILHNVDKDGSEIAEGA